MALKNGFPGHTALASFADLRRDLEGTVVRSAAGVLRAGVFPDHLDPLVTGRTDMKVNIADFRAVQNRGGAIFLANVGVDSSVTLDAAPASNKRIDLVYAYQQSVTLGDAASTPVFGVVKGTASATPTVPPLPAGVSTAIPLATVEIPAGATTTLSAGVVFTQVAPYTAMAGGTVRVRSTAEMNAWVPAVGSRVFHLAEKVGYERTASGWDRVKRVITGRVTLGSSVAAGAITTAVPVTFPAGAFATAPEVFTESDTIRLNTSAGSVTASGCDLYAANWSGAIAVTGAIIKWMAVG